MRPLDCDCASRVLRFGLFNDSRWTLEGFGTKVRVRKVLDVSIFLAI